MDGCSCATSSFLLAIAAVKDSPPEPLVGLLSSLRLAGPAEVRAVTGRARRLAGGLPLFESLWIDALAQARLITSWQAVEIDGGRGPTLQVGPFVLFERLATLGYATVYRARELEGGGFVRLVIAADNTDGLDAERRLSLLVRKAAELSQAHLSPVLQQGLDGKRLWAASAWLTGRTARQWMLGHGRCPPAMVLDIARQMLKGLVVCEQAAVVHGGLSVDQLWFDGRGEVWLPEPGLRGVLRPVESKQDELPTEAYDYLSPERAVSETLCDVRDDVYACGALWWHLLTGRPPFAGGTAAAKLRTLQTAKLPDLRQIVPETSAPLAETVMRCLSRDRQARPESMAAVAAALGEEKPRARRHLARRLRVDAGPRRLLGARAWHRAPRRSTWLAAAFGVLLVAAIVAWPGIAPRVDQPAGDATQKIAMVKRPPTREPSVKHRAAKRRRTAPLATPDSSILSVEPSQPAATAAYDRMAAMEPSDVQAAKDDLPQEADPLSPADEAGSVVHVSADDPAFDLARLRPDQTLHGDAQRRPIIEVPLEGLELAASGVTIENIDFVARQPLQGAAAMLTLRGLKATLRGCSFQTTGDVSPAEVPAAVCWDRDMAAGDTNADLSTGELELRDVALRRVGAGVTCRLAAGMVLRLDNVLCLESAAAVEFDRFPTADELAMLSLSRVTLRGARSLVQIGCDAIPESLGHLEIEAAGCAFVLPAAAALLLFEGEERPGPLLRGLRWSGQGCVLSPRSRLAIWRMPEGRMLAAADDAVPIEGVVRGEVGFAGSPDDSAAGSRIVRWQAPLISQQPPGIDDAALSLPQAGELASSTRQELNR